MTGIACPQCGKVRKIEQVFSADGWHNPACYNCGDPGWVNPAGAADPFEGYPMMTTTPASSYHPSNPQPDLRTASMSDLQHERNHPFESRRAAARAEIQRRGTHKVTVEVEVAAEDFADGWAGKSGELAESINAALFELQGDDGGAYQPTVTIGRRQQAYRWLCTMCDWSTASYCEIDGHENQLEPGHLVTGEAVPE